MINKPLLQILTLSLLLGATNAYATLESTTAIKQVAVGNLANVEVAAGFMTNPHLRNSLFSEVGLSGVFSCSNASSFCKRYSPEIFSFNGKIAISNDRFYSPLESNIPAAQFNFTAMGLNMGPKLKLSLGNFEFSRATRTLREDANFQVTPVNATLKFAETKHRFFESQCFVSFQGPGFSYDKYTTLQKGSNPPTAFIGLHAAGIAQGCAARLGPQKIHGFLGYQLGANVSIGQSGAGNTETQGRFGAIHSEYSAALDIGVWVGFSEKMKNYGFPGIKISAPVGFAYHMDRGCVTGVCSNNLSEMNIQVGLTITLPFRM